MARNFLKDEVPAKGTRVEIPVHFDAWMRGARFGVVMSGLRHGRAGESDYVYVRLDHPQLRRSLKLWRGDWEYARNLEADDSDFETWRADLLAKFRFFGLPNGFDEKEMRDLHASGFAPDDAYGVACDIHAGFPFDEAKAANAPRATR